MQGTLAGTAARIRLHGRGNLLRRAAPAHLDVRRLSDLRHFVRVSPAPRLLVYRAVQPDELVAAEPVRNSSGTYDYAEWNRTSRLTAAQHVHSDTRQQPKPQEPIELEPQVRVVPEAGGLMMFSGAVLHSTVPNSSGRTRFRIDFRTVHIGDVEKHHGAHNVDSACTGTTLRDFVRATDLAAMPEELAAAYESEKIAYVS